MSVIITAEKLREWKACRDGYKRFCKLFPEGATVEEAFVGLVKDGRPDWANWIAKPKRGNLTSLPEGFTVGWNLYLNGCTGLISLPEYLTVRGSLYINGCTGLKSISKGLTVGRDICIEGCTRLQSLPEDIKVGGTIYR